MSIILLKKKINSRIVVNEPGTPFTDDELE